MIAQSVASTASVPPESAKKSSLLRRIARAFFYGCAPIAGIYGFSPLPDEALYRQPRNR